MQIKVKEFNDNKDCHFKPMPVSARMLDIISEVGELSKEVLKATKYGTQDFMVDDEFILEYGDVLYSMMSLANEVGIDADVALDRVLDKYRARISNKGDMGSGR